MFFLILKKLKMPLQSIVFFPISLKVTHTETMSLTYEFLFTLQLMGVKNFPLAVNNSVFLNMSGKNLGCFCLVKTDNYMPSVR